MLIFAISENGVLKVGQQDVPPTVYLDHWAWLKFSESPSLSSRLTAALESSGGTVAISWLNLAEFCKLTDRQQAQQADRLLDAILPRIYFIQPDFFKVIRQEEGLLSPGAPSAPHEDSGMLKFFAGLNLSNAGSPKLFTAQNLCCLAQSAGSVARYEGMADKALGRIESLRQEFLSSPELQSLVKKMPSGKTGQHGTRIIMQELLRPFLVDRMLKVTRNNVIDLTHAIVPVSYCEYVLLDGQWEQLVNVAKKRIIKGGLSFPMAKVYSERRDGLKRFLIELETGCATTRP